MERAHGTDFADTSKTVSNAIACGNRARVAQGTGNEQAMI
jgi:hypothetical protein